MQYSVLLKKEVAIVLGLEGWRRGSFQVPEVESSVRRQHDRSCPSGPGDESMTSHLPPEVSCWVSPCTDPSRSQRAESHGPWRSPHRVETFRRNKQLELGQTQWALYVAFYVCLVTFTIHSLIKKKECAFGWENQYIVFRTSVYTALFKSPLLLLILCIWYVEFQEKYVKTSYLYFLNHKFLFILHSFGFILLGPVKFHS